MRQRNSLFGIVAILVLLGTYTASAQTLYPGGLTALPTPNPGVNRVANGGFENNLTSWTANGGVAWSVATGVAHSGSKSLQLTGSGGNLSQPIAVTKGTYRVSAWVKTQGYGNPADPAGRGDMGFRLMFDERDAIQDWPGVPGGFWEQDFHGTYDWTYFEGVFVVVRDITVNLRLWLDGSPVGTAWIDDIKVEKLEPHPIEAFMRYPNYRGMVFDEQSLTMMFDVAVTPPAGDFARYVVRVALHQEVGGQLGAEVTHTDFAAAATLTPALDGGLMSVGQPYRVHISLRDTANGNAEVYAYPDFRVSRVSGSTHASMKVSFDADNNVMLNGTKRFLLGVYDGGSPHFSANWSNYLWSDQPAPGDDFGTRFMNGLRINTYLNIFSGGTGFPTKGSMLSALHDGTHDAMNLEIANCVDIYAGGNDLLAISSDSHVQSLAAHPGNMGYYTADECKGHLVDDAFAVYDRLRRLDPSSLAFGALYPDSTISLWAEAADVISTDPYPNSVAGTPHNLVADTAKATRLTVHDARPFATVLQFNNAMSQVNDAAHRRGFPTKEEMRTDAYMAIVEGAKGLVWWSIAGGGQRGALTNELGEFWTDPDKIALMQQLKDVVGEIANLESLLISKDANGRLTSWTANGVQQVGLDIPQAVVRTKVKVGAGPQCSAPPCAYVIAYNYTNQSNVSAQFNWSVAPGAVKRYPDSTAVSVSGNTFSDTFGPYQARVYVVPNAGNDTALRVWFDAPADGATVSGTVPVTLHASGGDALGFGTAYTFTFSDGINTFTGSGDPTVTFQWNTSQLSPGTRQLTGSVRDPVNNTAQATPITVNVAAQGCNPSITTPANGSTVSGTVTVTMWGCVQPNTFTLFIDNVQVFQQQVDAASTTYSWNTAGLTNAQHTLYVTVADVGGHTGTSPTTTVTVNNIPSSFAVFITAPTAGQTISGTNWVTIWSENAAPGAVQYVLYVDDVQKTQGPQSSPQPTSLAWDTTTVQDGARTIKVVGTDSQGHTATATVSVTVANGPALAVFITSPTANQTVSGTNWVTIWSENAIGAVQYVLYVDNVQKNQGPQSSPQPTSIPWDTTTVQDGTRTIKVVGTDGAGRTATATVTVNVANGPPLAVFITSPTAGQTISGTNWVVIWSENAIGTVNYVVKVNGQTVAQQGQSSPQPTSIPWDTHVVSNGSQTITVIGTDGAGRTATATQNVTVSN